MKNYSNDFSMDFLKNSIDPKTFKKAQKKFSQSTCCNNNSNINRNNYQGGRIGVNDFSNLKAPEFVPSIWFKLFPCSLTVKIPKEFMKECYYDLKNISGGAFIGEDLYAFAYEKYTGRNIMDGSNGILYFCCIVALIMFGIAKFLGKI